MSAKFKIKFLRNLIRQIEYKITEIADEAVGPEGITVVHSSWGKECTVQDDAQWFYISDEWDCPKSPFGLCMYHTIHDRAHDDCVFCHEPQERK